MELTRNNLFSKALILILFSGISFSIGCAEAPSARLDDDPGKESSPVDPTPTPENPPIVEEPEEPTPPTPVEPPRQPYFVEPNYTEDLKAHILGQYDYLDPQKLVPTALLEKTVLYYHANKHLLKNQNYMSVINFSSRSNLKRFFIINMSTGSTWAVHTAHGKGSDSNHDGYAEKFSNTPNSNASSLGFYVTAETYQGSNGYSLRLDGKSSTNSNARSRAIVIHGASYVQDANVIQGRSWGCPAVANQYRDQVINTIKGGSLIYAGLTN